MTKEKRIALVTGANKGIGFEVARDLARKGFHVFLGARDTEAGEAAAEKLQKEDYGEITFLKIDVSKPDSVRRAAEEFSKESKERRAAHRECLKRRRPIGRWRRWLGTRLLHFKNGTQRRHLTTGCGFAEIRRQFRLSGLGPD